MKFRSILRLMVIGAIAFSAVTSCSRAQTPLGKIFKAIKTGTPAEAEAARESLPALLEQEMPTIEKETSTICSSLRDSDAYIRQQASALLKIILITAPTHSGVATSCTPELLATVNDSDVEVRQNVLFSLASNMSGQPSPLAHHAFVQAFGSTDYRIAQYGAIGLLREDGGKNSANLGTIEAALRNAPDSPHRLNLLYAIEGSEIVSDDLARLSEKLVSDPDPETQSAAVDAICSASSDKSKARTFLQNLEGNSTLSTQSKQHAESVISQLQSKNSCPGPSILLF